MARWRSSAAYRIAFINFGAYALGLALLGCAVFGMMHMEFKRQLDSRVSDEAHALAEEYRSSGDRELAKEIGERQEMRSRTHTLYGVFAPDGRRLYGSLQARRPPTGLHWIHFYDPGEGPDTARAMTIDLSDGERLAVAIDSEWLEDVEAYVIAIFVAAFAGACIVGFGGAVILGSYLQRRLHSISSSAEAIIGGDIRRRMPISEGEDEFDQLAATLNRMLARIEGLLDNLRQVSSDIAHDLRTPLARLRNHLERGAPEGKGSDVLIADAIRQVDEVLSLFSAILRVAEVESGETRRYFGRVDLTALVNEIGESYADAFDDHGRTLLWSAEPGLQVAGDRELLAQAIVNLLENAQRHTPTGTVVRLTATSSGGMAFVQVADDGPGVPNADLGKITKRFARVESSRNTPGHGLGLSLVSAVVRLHDGHLILSNGHPGLNVRITLPLARAASG